ncbi:CBU_0592 family membrane protein [Echinicola rosea]|uniref:CBU-0592-like domain-containing protein n=1 Tax=Echinicola rosea TaxID=1807691 RepID=A0ABQ1V7D3_9BACT|nr:hypothetical protein [Echinicola rosea]GGF40200.1 hypothetical protein GCM10011339_30930 [Echinicola rosea]
MVFEIFGWLGAVLYIVSYFMLSKGWLRQEAITYHLMNLGGAICLVVHAVHLTDRANILVNGVWAIIAIMAIYKFRSSFLRNKS